MDALRALIREVPDFPKPGILFYDITTLLQDSEGLVGVMDALVDEAKAFEPDVIVAIDARGFMFGPHVALRLGIGFVPVRKAGKLPADTVSESYDLEYGTDQVEMHRDAVAAGQRVVIVDDLLATGGTATAACRLVEQLGGVVAAVLFVVELDFLKGRVKLEDRPVVSLVHYGS